MRNLRRALVGLVLISVVCFGLIGFAHTPYGRPLFPVVQLLFGKPKSCPLGYGKPPSLAEQKRNAENYIASHARAKTTASKPVPDFTFGQTRKADIELFVKDHSGECTTIKSGELECLNVRTAHGTKSMWVTFGQDTILTHIREIETLDDATQASINFGSLVDQLESSVGQPTASHNSYQPEQLKSGLLYQASREYYYHNYFSILRVTNHGKTFTISSEFSDPEAYASLTSDQVADAKSAN